MGCFHDDHVPRYSSTRRGPMSYEYTKALNYLHIYWMSLHPTLSTYMRNSLRDVLCQKERSLSHTIR